jgi:hypothetical protein
MVLIFQFGYGTAIDQCALCVLGCVGFRMIFKNIHFVSTCILDYPYFQSLHFILSMLSVNVFKIIHFVSLCIQDYPFCHSMHSILSIILVYTCNSIHFVSLS